MSPHIGRRSDADIPAGSGVALFPQVRFNFLERESLKEGSGSIPGFKLETKDDGERDKKPL
jgi:hypothetical protein